MISIVLPVFNHEDLIERVLQGISVNSSSMVKELIIIIDGCTDRSEELIMKFTNDNPNRFKYIILRADNVFEVKACRMGMLVSTEPYCMSIQDDMVITWFGYDLRLMKPFLMWDDVFAVTSLASCNIIITLEDTVAWDDLRNDQNTPRNIFAIRDTINRGPLLWRHDRLEQLGYSDEIYAPQGADDIDLSMRAWVQHGWVSGTHPMPAFFDISWGTTRRTSASITAESDRKNMIILKERYRRELTGLKHSEDRELP